MTQDPSDNSVRAFLRRRGAAAHVVSGGAEALIAGWKRFVGQVEAGYKFGLDDYRNDLDIRGLIEAAGLADHVADDDRSVSRRAHPHRCCHLVERQPNAFWVNGYPANASGALLDDLKAAVVSGFDAVLKWQVIYGIAKCQ